VTTRSLLVAGAALLPGVVLAQSSSTASLASHMTAQSYVTVANSSPNLAQYKVPPGPQYSGVAYLFVTRSDLPEGFGDVCTGALINNGHSILTAAHCLANSQGQLQATSVDVRLTNDGGKTYTTTQAHYFHVNPQYTGNVIDTHDIAVINLDSAMTGFTSYDLYNQDAVGQNYDVVGWGTRGTGQHGASPNDLFSPRHGYNTFDFSTDNSMFGSGSDSFWGGQDVYMSDFDNGKPGNDASCWLTSFFTADNSPYCNLGLGTNEVDTAPGDSGGPEFVWVNGHYEVAGVTSFGITFGRGERGNEFHGPDIDNVLNSSYGEFAGYTRVDINSNWIYANTPEPSSVALLATGLLGLVPVMRRRRGK